MAITLSTRMYLQHHSAAQSEQYDWLEKLCSGLDIYSHGPQPNEVS